MKFAMKRMVLEFLCGGAALTVVACGDGGRIATAPSPSATVPSVAAKAPAGVARPFQGTLALELVGEPAFEPPSTVSVHFTGTGEATHLGRFTATLDLDIDVSNEPAETSSGTVTLKSADGDSIFGTVAGRATAVGEGHLIVETVTIVRGTGRFADATGTFVINRVDDRGSFEGTIVY